jgi:hypothetical protein
MQKDAEPPPQDQTVIPCYTLSSLTPQNNSQPRRAPTATSSVRQRLLHLRGRPVRLLRQLYPLKRLRPVRIGRVGALRLRRVLPLSQRLCAAERPVVAVAVAGG